MRDTLIRTSALAAVVAACLVAAPVGAQQQQQPPQPGSPQDVTPQTSFSEEQIDAFAAAAQDVTRLQQEYDTKLQTAGNEQEVETLRGEAADAMMNVLEDQGLTPEEYNSILQAAQADPALYAAIVERMEAVE
ncbi:MAG TPA: DUF4168 domain-containing protein [Geminicoccaceae bacterium]|nr:DUF4168 domain-containing protein [Geminicoccaceae bacterium]